MFEWLTGSPPGGTGGYTPAVGGNAGSFMAPQNIPEVAPALPSDNAVGNGDVSAGDAIEGINPSLWQKIQNALKGMSPEDVAKEMNNISSIMKNLNGINKITGKSKVAQQLLQEHQVLQQKMLPSQPPQFGPSSVPMPGSPLPPGGMGGAPALDPNQAQNVLASMGLA